MWGDFATALTAAALGDAIGDVLAIPIVTAVGLGTMAVGLVVFAFRRIKRLAPQS